MKTLIVAPMRREARVLDGDVLVCGAGRAAGPAVAERLRQAPADLIIIAGVCGALDPSLAVADLILGSRVVAAGASERSARQPIVDAASRALRTSGVRFIGARLLTVDQPAVSRIKRRDLWNVHGAAGVDMETYHAAAAAEENGAAWIALRAVSDPASMALPAPLRNWRGEADNAAIARSIAIRPLTWPATIRLALAMRRALYALSQSLPLIVEAAASAAAAPVSEGRPEQLPEEAHIITLAGVR